MPGAMRVLSVGNMYPPASTGGYELVWRSAVEHLRGRGAEVLVLTSDHRAGELDAEPGVDRVLRMYWADHEFPRLPWRDRVRIERENASLFEERVAALRPDVLSWWAMGGLSLSLVERGRRSGVPAVGVVCDDWMLYGPRVDGWLAPLAGHPLRAGVARRRTGLPTALDLGSSAHWLFLSETLRRRAAEGGVDVAGSEISNRGADDEAFVPAPDREWGWRLLYIGRIDPRKGVDTAIEALPRLDERATLVVDGGGDERHRTELEQLAVRLGVRSRVEFVHSERGQVPQAYADADAVVFPVRWDEPWGLVPLEAMATGRPVIATGCGGSSEYLRDRVNCLLFPPSDPDGLAAAAAELAADPALRDRLRRGGFETAARFSERAFNEQVAHAHERAARGAAP